MGYNVSNISKIIGPSASLSVCSSGAQQHRGGRGSKTLRGFPTSLQQTSLKVIGAEREQMRDSRQLLTRFVYENK